MDWNPRCPDHGLELNILEAQRGSRIDFYCRGPADGNQHVIEGPEKDRLKQRILRTDVLDRIEGRNRLKTAQLNRPVQKG